MKVQKCSYQCDRPDCKHESAPAANFTDARKSAETAGWFIRPSETAPQHICPSCVESALTRVDAPAGKGSSA